MVKNKYSEEYDRVLKLNKRGRAYTDAVYKGGYYVLPFDEKGKKKRSWINIGAVFLLFAIWLMAGLLNQDSSKTFWIVYPYLFILLPLGYMLMGAVSFFGAPLRMQNAQYQTSLARLKHSCIGAMCLSGLSALLDIIYIFTHWGDIALARELLYLASHIVFIVAAFAYGKCYDRIYSGITVETPQETEE